MLVNYWGMPVGMRVRLLPVPRKIMLMLVMSVVAVGMSVFHRLVDMLMLVPFPQMQPYAQRHQRCSKPEQDTGYLRP